MMDSQVERGLDYGLFERCQEAKTWLAQKVPEGSTIAILGDDDPDGTTSAFVLRNALERLGYKTKQEFVVLHTPEHVAGAFKTPADAYVVADCGSALISEIDSIGAPVLILDHHGVRDYQPTNVFEVNPRRIGGDDVSFVSASIVCQVFAEVLDPENASTAFAAAAGGVADRQHLGGWNGLMLHVAETAVRTGSLARKEGITLSGNDIAEALWNSLDPYFVGLTGEEAASKALLVEHGIDPAVAPLDLPKEKAKALSKTLERNLRESGAVFDRVYPLYGPAYALENGAGVSTLFGLVRILETLTAENRYKQALAVLAGDSDAAAAGHASVIAYHRRILAEIAKMRKNVEARTHYKVAKTEDPSDTGVYAHAFFTFISGGRQPFFVYNVARDRTKFSGRAGPQVLAKGYDVARALGAAARRVGGHGGGHPAAAGASVATESIPAFLDALDEALATQVGAS